MTFARVALAVALLLPGSGAQAFEMIGFRGGMSLDAFTDHARSLGFQITMADRAGKDLPESAWAGRRDLTVLLKRKEEPRRLAASLCEGRLQSLTEVRPGDLDEYVRRVALGQQTFVAPGTAGRSLVRRTPAEGSLTTTSVRWPDASGRSAYRVEIVSVSGSTLIHTGWSTRLEGCEDG